jgi:tetratricopeptide (TPR) repeat protein
MAKAGEYLKKLLELNDKVGIFWWFQAIYESKIGDEKSLKDALDRAKDLKYDWDEMPNNIEFVADTLNRRNKHREAARYYETLLKIPDLEWQTEFRNQAKLMKTYLLLGEKKKATELAKIALEKSPQNQKAQVEAILKELGLK